MKLINSRTESLIRERLLKFESIILKNDAINDLLNHQFSQIESVYCLNQVIEQGEDIYTLLVNNQYIIEFELSRIDGVISKINIQSLNQYKKEVKDKSSRLTLSIAMDLSNKT